MPRTTATVEAAEALAIRALSFLAEDPVLLGRFVALSGIEIAALRKASAEPGFLAGVLRFVAGHESTLLAFAAAAEVQPVAVMEALRTLPGGDDHHLVSP